MIDAFNPQQIVLLAYTTMTLGLLSTSAIANGQTVQHSDTCDQLAAHPDDAGRLSPGVNDRNIVPAPAIAACRAAAKASPNIPRLQFQLARAFLAGGDKKGARDSLILAARQNYPAAIAYLGDFYLNGWTLDVDVDSARQFYQQAAEDGFAPAARRWERITLDASLFAHELAGRIFAAEVAPAIPDDASQPGREARAYLFTFHQQILDQCLNLPGPADVASPYHFRFAGGGAEDRSERIQVSAWADTGKRDARRFTARHGCDGFVAQQMIQRLYLTFDRDSEPKAAQ